MAPHCQDAQKTPQDFVNFHRRIDSDPGDHAVDIIQFPAKGQARHGRARRVDRYDTLRNAKR
jgi:hypothetical protein